MRVAKIYKTSLEDGYGINFTIFFQGCNKVQKCPGCHNPSTHDPKGGHEISVEALQKMILEVYDDITGVTFTGGEPLDQIEALVDLAYWCHANNLTTTLFTGFTLPEIEAYPIYLFNYIIDGPFQMSKKDLSLAFRGSSNQRILVKGKDY